MIWYLFKTLALLIFSFVVLVNYYFIFPWHLEEFNGYIFYVTIIGIFYWIYKYFQLNKSSEVAIFSPMKVVWFFLLNLFVLCIYFFHLVWSNPWNWIELFFKIIFFSLLPILILSITTSFWNKIVNKLPQIDIFWESWKTLLSIVLWLFSFLFLITIFAILWFYNIYVVLIILSIFIWLSYNNLLDLYKTFINNEYKFDIKEGSYIRFFL